jgi:hypothetical protein
VRSADERLILWLRYGDFIVDDEMVRAEDLKQPRHPSGAHHQTRPHARRLLISLFIDNLCLANRNAIENI